MKCAAVLFIMISLICSLYSGCDVWMAGEYLSIQPHQEQEDSYGNELREVNTFVQMRNWNILAFQARETACCGVRMMFTLDEMNGYM